MGFLAGYLESILNSSAGILKRKLTQEGIWMLSLCNREYPISSRSLSTREIIMQFLILRGASSERLGSPFFLELFRTTQPAPAAWRQRRVTAVLALRQQGGLARSRCRPTGAPREGGWPGRGASPPGKAGSCFWGSCTWALGAVGVRFSQELLQPHVFWLHLETPSLLKAGVWLTEPSVLRESFCHYCFSCSFATWV